MRWLLILCTISCIGCFQSSKKFDQDQIQKIILDLQVADDVIRMHPADDRDSVKTVLINRISNIHDLGPHELSELVDQTTNDVGLYREITTSIIKQLDSLKNQQIDKTSFQTPAANIDE